MKVFGIEMLPILCNAAWKGRDGKENACRAKAKYGRSSASGGNGKRLKNQNLKKLLDESPVI